MSALAFRPLEASNKNDCRFVANIYRLAIADAGLPPLRYLSNTNIVHDLTEITTTHSLVAELAGRRVATLFLGAHRVLPQVGTIEFISVDAAYRRQGIGRQALAYAEDLMIGDGYDEAMLESYERNTGAADFYRNSQWICRGPLFDYPAQLSWTKHLRKYNA